MEKTPVTVQRKRPTWERRSGGCVWESRETPAFHARSSMPDPAQGSFAPSFGSTDVAEQKEGGQICHSTLRAVPNQIIDSHMCLCMQVTLPRVITRFYCSLHCRGFDKCIAKPIFHFKSWPSKGTVLLKQYQQKSKWSQWPREGWHHKSHLTSCLNVGEMYSPLGVLISVLLYWWGHTFDLAP